MRRKALYYFGLGLLLMSPISLSAQNKEEKKQERAQMVKEYIETKCFKIEPRSAITMNGRNISLNSRFSLTVRNDSIFSDLPYFGRAYSLPYGGGEGLNFESKILEYKQSIGKKGNYEIKFSTRTNEDYYTFRIDIFDNGSSNINVNMQKKQSIDFIGDLVFEEDK